MALVAVVAAAYLLSAIMLTREVRVKRPDSAPLAGSQGATSIIHNFNHVESRLDKVSWELSASKAELLGNQAKLYDIKMRFYTPEREVVALLGQDGTIDLSTNNISVKGKVTAIYNDQYYFYADEIEWDAARKLLLSPGPVRIVGPQGEVQGKGGSVLLARPSRKRFIIKGGVTVDFKGNLDGRRLSEEDQPS